MQLDSRTYERAKNRGRLTITKDPANPTTHALVSVDFYDKETGDRDTVTESISLSELQDIRQKTHQERNRLDTMITDFTTTLAAP